VLETASRAVVFETFTTNPNLCPGNFFRDSAAELDRAWRQVGAQPLGESDAGWSEWVPAKPE
jgi:hypothetical protein